MQTILLLFLSWMSFAIPLPTLHFTYQPVEGDASTHCSHEKIRDLPDYQVVCGTPDGKKVFTAHVIVRGHSGVDKTGLELLYWVTAPGETPTSPHKFHSTTALMRFSGQTSLQEFRLSQGIENDMAWLVLDWTAP